jgi:hypothetical protein
MKIKKILLGVIAMLSITSCGTTMQTKQMLKTSYKLEQKRNIYIAKIEDGAFNGKIYNGSGLSVANYFKVYMQPYAAQISSEENADYIVKAIIMHWEPRRAELSGIPTKVKIQVSIIDARSGNELINNELNIKGRSVTFVPQSAEGLAEYMIKNFCNDIF